MARIWDSENPELRIKVDVELTPETSEYLLAVSQETPEFGRHAMVLELASVAQLVRSAVEYLQTRDPLARESLVVWEGTDRDGAVTRLVSRHLDPSDRPGLLLVQQGEEAAVIGFLLPDFVTMLERVSNYLNEQLPTAAD